jgi:hypothetical protein
MLLSTIIVNWNTNELVLKCLQSIEDTHFANSEIILVDNASQDGSVETVKQRFPLIKLLENPGNVGFGAANNQGFAQSSGKYILFLNPDTEVAPDAVSVLLDFMETHPKAGAAGPLLLNTDGSLQLSCSPFPTLLRETWRMFLLDNLIHFGEYNQKKWDQTKTREVDSIKGACMVIRREALDQVGLFDPNYYMYTEEIDLCYRIKHADWKLFWVPQAKVIHHGGQSTRLVAEKMFLSLFKTKILFFRKHFGNLSAFLYKIILFAASLPRAAVGLIAWFFPETTRKHYLALAKRYFRLISALKSL